MRVTKFLKNSYRIHWLPKKRDARERLAQHIISRVPHERGMIKMLTMPGGWWHFERLFSSKNLYAGNNKKWKASFTCIESCSTVFKVAAARIPHRNRGIKCSRFQELNAPTVTNRKDISFINCDIHEYVAITSKTFHVIWLDICSPITEQVISTINLLPSLFNDGWAFFALTVLGAREDKKIGNLINIYDCRLEFFHSICEQALGSEFGHIETIRYMDSVPMVQLMYERRDET